MEISLSQDTLISNLRELEQIVIIMLTLPYLIKEDSCIGLGEWEHTLILVEANVIMRSSIHLMFMLTVNYSMSTSTITNLLL